MLGGPGSLPGYELGELRPRDYWTASGSYRWKIRDIMMWIAVGRPIGNDTVHERGIFR